MEIAPPRSSARSLRPLKPVNYFPKPQLFNLVENKPGFSGRRSQSAEPLRRQSCGLGNQVIPGRRTQRSQTIDGRGRNDVMQRTVVPARRAFRSGSVDNFRPMPPHGIQRLQTNDGNHSGCNAANQPAMYDLNAFQMLTQTQAILTADMIKMKDDLAAQIRKADLLSKQDTANQKLIAQMAKEAENKDVHMAAMREELAKANNRIGMQFFTFNYVLV